MTVIARDPVDDAAGDGDIDRLVKIAQQALDTAIRASFAAGRETQRRKHEGAVEALRELLPWAEGAQIRTNADVDRKAAALARARTVTGGSSR